MHYVTHVGLRVGEVVDLKLNDLLAPPQANQPARLRVCGKGQKERVVLLIADAYAVLEAWLQERPATDQPYLFLNQRGRPLTPSGIQWLLKRYGKQVDVQVTPHQLRHTYSRQLTEAGMPVTSLSKLLGHAQITTTQIYTAGADPELCQAYRTAMERLEVSPPPSPQPAAPPAPTGETIHVDVPEPAPLPDWEAWAPNLPPDIRMASLDYVQRQTATWKPILPTPPVPRCGSESLFSIPRRKRGPRRTGPTAKFMSDTSTPRSRTSWFLPSFPPR